MGMQVNLKFVLDLTDAYRKHILVILEFCSSISGELLGSLGAYIRLQYLVYSLGNREPNHSDLNLCFSVSEALLGY